MRTVKTTANVMDCLVSDRQCERNSAGSNLFKLSKYPGVHTAPIPISKDETLRSGGAGESLMLLCRWADSAPCL